MYFAVSALEARIYLQIPKIPLAFQLTYTMYTCTLRIFTSQHKTTCTKSFPYSYMNMMVKWHVHMFEEGLEAWCIKLTNLQN